MDNERAIKILKGIEQEYEEDLVTNSNRKLDLLIWKDVKAAIELAIKSLENQENPVEEHTDQDQEETWRAIEQDRTNNIDDLLDVL